MDNIETLNEAIFQYETQLSQVKLAISASSSGCEKDNLISLQNDIEELIHLTKENLASLKKKSDEINALPSASTLQNTDRFAEEYALFKAEIESETASNSNLDTSTGISSADIKSELNALQGMKCQAPHRHQWGGEVTYHNALVFSVNTNDDISDIEHIQVRVMFTNPTHKEMLPCPYFLEGECRFSDEKCHFSHGELVPFSQLKEYKDPDFSSVRAGTSVLVKHSDDLWHRAIISSIIDNNRCKIKFESSGKVGEVDLHDILPLESVGRNALEDSDSRDSSSGDESDDSRENAGVVHDPILVEKSLLSAQSSVPLGGWEKHTKGIGSRLMAQMGYITGAGLGKHGEGRVEPVEAVVLPAGKSLDHCMNLRAQAGGDENLFKVEKRLKKLQKKQKALQAKQYEREKEKTNVFDFLNHTLRKSKGNSPATSATNLLKTNATTVKPSQKDLNVQGFRVGEEIKKVERDLVKLQESLSRHNEGSSAHSHISGKIQEKAGELSHLKASEHSINKERSKLSDRKKLSVF